ncbi:PAS domain-containing sensor histidine kinase [Azospirillum cavernae]|uniref:histidine kinase n=1 Tax=Azospirillum cavernae TaxID=2320860 RepID=A0A418VWQ5_9PROT|nr:PAS domain-containing sensor histidine kinase [Azospirillum cavernae]RJF81581.1 PAS domain-containing sensor histidine kinase [Azospirillum cavernae]
MADVAGLGGWFWNRANRRRAAEQDAMARDAAARLAADHAGQLAAAQLEASPWPWCAWSAAGEGRLSAEAGALLGIDHADALTQTLNAPDLPDALVALRRDGTPFRCVAQTTDGRSLALTGRRGGADAASWSVVWIEDVTATAAATNAAREQDAARAAAETALADLRAAVDALPIPVWLRDGALNLSWCNRAYARAVDASPAAALAERSELAPGGAGRALAERARGGGFAQSARFPIVIGTERRLLDVTEAPLSASHPAAAGGGVQLVGYALDQTPLEEARDELSRHLAAHAEVLERLGSAIAIFGADTRLKFFNQAYARLWNLDEGWLRGEPTNAEVLEELRSRRRLPEYADYQTFKRERLTRYTHLIEPVEELLHLPDGTTLRHMAAPHPLGGLITILEDVTNTLALESSYNTLMAVQRETLDNLAEGIAVFGGDGRLKLFNPAFARVWDLHDEDLQGEPHIADVIERMRPLLHAASSDDRDPALADGPDGSDSALDGAADEDWEALKDELIGATLERAVRSGRVERSDGSVVEFSTLPLPDGAVLNSYLDVTDGARLEQALRASNAALEAADQLKGEFVASVSHHLRAPLTGIVGLAESLTAPASGGLSAAQAACVQGVLDTAKRALDLIGDAAGLTSLGVGVTTLERGTVDIAELLDGVAGLTREWARRAGLRLELHAPARLGSVEGDGKRLKQALFTLVVAAIRHPPPDRRIRLSGQRADDRVILAVSAAAQPPGDAAPAATVVSALSLARNVAELHGGRLESGDGGGRGALVRCVLPLRAAVNGARG